METTGRHNEDLSLNAGIVRKLLVDFIRDETHRAGFHVGVIGLSGGIDSAVCACLAVEALGREHVRLVMMPYRTSNALSRSDAELIAGQLAVSPALVDISSMVDAYLAQAGQQDTLRSGNVMARARMIVLYDVSSREKGLVLGTSNKTELLLGYGTMFGDLASAINPLGDLYKTQVWQLAAHLGIPASIIEKKPSADLWEGQTDEADFGFSYARVDHLLYCLVDERRTDMELEQRGFDRLFIEKVRGMMVRNQFKRRLPLIAKISNRTINVDFRYPRDWGI